MSSGQALPTVFPDPTVSARYAGRELGIDEIQTLLPHRPPFLLLDRVIELEPGKHGVGLKGVTIGEPFFQGHFPGYPVMPGVLIVEALAQLAGVVVLAAIERGDMLTLFASIDEARFRLPVRPGDQLRLEADVIQVAVRFGRVLSKFELKAFVADKLVTQAQCRFMLAEPE